MATQARFCPECGGILKYEPPLKQFICSSCGLMYTREKLDEDKGRMFEADDEKAKATKKRRDALKWWLNKKE